VVTPVTARVEDALISPLPKTLNNVDDVPTDIASDESGKVVEAIERSALGVLVPIPTAPLLNIETVSATMKVGSPGDPN
jgi:hypothetical protein